MRKIGSFIQNVASEAKVVPDGLDLEKFCLYGIYYCHLVWGSVPMSVDEPSAKCPPVSGSRQLPALPARLARAALSCTQREAPIRDGMLRDAVQSSLLEGGRGGKGKLLITSPLITSVVPLDERQDGEICYRLPQPQAALKHQHLAHRTRLRHQPIASREAPCLARPRRREKGAKIADFSQVSRSKPDFQ